VMACFNRGFFKDSDHTPGEEWLTQQLRGTRDQLCKKSDFCDELAMRLRDMEADVKKRSTAEYEVRELLNTCNSELRSATRAREQQDTEFSDLRRRADSLQEETETLRGHEAESEALAAQLEACRQAEASREAEAVDLRKQLAQQELTAEKAGDLADAAPKSGHWTWPTEEHFLRDADVAAGGCPSPISPQHDNPKVERYKLMGRSPAESKLKAEIAIMHKSMQAAAARETDLQEQLRHERELHEGALRMLGSHKKQGVEQQSELRQDLTDLSSSLEQKEEDILSIAFDMVELKNRLADQVCLVSENADAFQVASEELAEKDERLSDALVRQEELLAQVNSVSSQLQGKVEQLSQELDRSRAAYQALDEQTRVVVSGLEKERDGLMSELTHLRTEVSEVAPLRAELQNVRAAAEEREVEAQQSLDEFKAYADRETARASKLATQLAEVRQQLRTLEQHSSDASGFAQEIAARKRRENALQEALRAETQRTMGLQDQLVSATERMVLTDVQIHDLTSALERAQFIERQAVERAQEYRTSLEMYREFGREDFMLDEIGFPSPNHEDPQQISLRGAQVQRSSSRQENQEQPSSAKSSPSRLSSVLLSVEMDLGFTTATLSIAPWQTKADFDTVVQDFLEEHRVRPVFKDALVRYLEEV